MQEQRWGFRSKAPAAKVISVYADVVGLHLQNLLITFNESFPVIS